MGQKPLREDDLYVKVNKGTNIDTLSHCIWECVIPFASGLWTENGNSHLYWSLQVYWKY